jgi:hypothetical protein
MRFALAALIFAVMLPAWGCGENGHFEDRPRAIPPEVDPDQPLLPPSEQPIGEPTYEFEAPADQPAPEAGTPGRSGSRDRPPENL